MTKKIIILTMLFILIPTFAFAATSSFSFSIGSNSDYFSGQHPSYYSNETHYYKRHHYRPFHPHNVFSYGSPDLTPDFIANSHNTVLINTDGNPFWIDMTPFASLPNDLVIGGGDAHEVYHICRGRYNGGLHPGKLIGQNCYISWGGREVRLPNYQVLTSPSPLAWSSTSNGHLPSNAIYGGYENQHSIYICQAVYRGAMIPGKIIGSWCNIAWNGTEMRLAKYNVLVR